jgi:hypothetical protein
MKNKDKYLKDTRPGIFTNQVYKLVKPLEYVKQFINYPADIPKPVQVINRCGILVWKSLDHLTPATKKNFQDQKK